MVCACTGLPPGELMRTMTPCVFLSLNAACSDAVIFSALASVPGAISPESSTIAVCFLPPVRSPRLLQSTSTISRNVTYAKVSSLKKIPQRRRRRCSTSASAASFVISSRSQGALLSVIFDPREINHAIVFLHQELHQRRAVARPADAASARRVVGGAVGRAKEIASVRIEKYSFLPIEFHRDVRAAVEIRLHPAPVPDGEGRRRLAEVLDLEAHAASRIGQRPRWADQPCCISHRSSSGTLATQARG